MKMYLKRVLAGWAHPSELTHQVSELIWIVLSTPADMKDRVGEGMTILSSTLAEIHCGVSGMSAHAFGEHFMRPVWKLRHQENVRDQLVRECHYHLNCS